MKFTLKDYQADAVRDVLANLKIARSLFKDQSEKQNSSFSLSATTGAGKTVMAAAAIEALFWGSDVFDFIPDPGAVVLWFSDDPSLNKQTFNRLLQASEKFNYNNLVQIEPPFAAPRLEPGNVYFLNTQKLSKNSQLTRGDHETLEGHQRGRLAPPDAQAWSIWQTIANTIDSDDLTLYLVLDEAHRGFNPTGIQERSTIVRRLVKGTMHRCPIPIVWGISATIERFQAAMNEAEASGNRQALPAVEVSPARVQESGLVKDNLSLYIPNEVGNFDSVLVRRAAKFLKESSERWAEYSRSQNLSESVEPLLVLQTPNTPNPDEIGVALDTIFDEFRELNRDSVRHVLGDHNVQQFGAWNVKWIEPQLVQDETGVRVLIAKDAISTGWDCPRAEVLVSFRAATDQTHITQLLGRMVRNPLARRIPGDERLNSVDCILPFFDRTTAGNVVRYLTGEIDSMPGRRKKILIDAKELKQNPNVPKEVWDVWSSMPTQTLPQRGAQPVKRLIALAQALSKDGVMPGALAKVCDNLHKTLDKRGEEFSGQLEAAISEIWAVHVQEIAGKLGKAGLTYKEFVERADDRAIRTGFESAKKAFGADVAQSYVNYLAGDDDDDDGLREAYVRTAALATVKEIRESIDSGSVLYTGTLFETYEDAIRQLSDARQQHYEEIRAMSTLPQRGSLRTPRTRLEGFSEERDGKLVPSTTVKKHLLADENGDFPLSTLNNWEREVVATELKKPSVCGWYRNPSRAAVDSIGIAYRDDTTANWRSMHPDFLVFEKVDGAVVASLVDPHGIHLDDALMKLKAIAKFAETFGDEFHRVDSLAKIDGRMKKINLKSDVVREAVLAAIGSAEEIFRSRNAVEYDPK